MVFNELDDAEAALQYTLMSQEKSPQKVPPSGWRYLQLGHLEEAKYYLQSNLREKSFFPLFQGRIINCLFQLKDWDAAAQYIDRQIELSDGNLSSALECEWARIHMAYLKSGDLVQYIDSRAEYLQRINAQRLNTWKDFRKLLIWETRLFSGTLRKRWKK